MANLRIQFYACTITRPSQRNRIEFQSVKHGSTLNLIRFGDFYVTSVSKSFYFRVFTANLIHYLTAPSKHSTITTARTVTRPSSKSQFKCMYCVFAGHVIFVSWNSFAHAQLHAHPPPSLHLEGNWSWHTSSDTGIHSVYTQYVVTT